jgi:hypothetical protein
LKRVTAVAGFQEEHQTSTFARHEKQPRERTFQSRAQCFRVPAMNGLVFSDAWSGKCGLEHSQTVVEQGALRNLNTQTTPCTDRTTDLSSTPRHTMAVVMQHTARTILCCLQRTFWYRLCCGAIRRAWLRGTFCDAHTEPHQQGAASEQRLKHTQLLNMSQNTAHVSE